MSGIVDLNGVCQVSVDGVYVLKVCSVIGMIGMIGIIVVDGFNIGQFFDVVGNGIMVFVIQIGDIVIGGESWVNS